MRIRGVERDWRPTLVRSVLFSGCAVVALWSASSGAQAACDPTAPGWTTDRIDPQVFETGCTYQGRDDVVHIQTFAINSTGDAFYNYEGKSTPTGNPIGSGFVTADLYIPDTWATTADGVRRAGIWPVIGTVVPPLGKSYPIVEFTNSSGIGKIHVYDVTDFVDQAATINYNAWNTIRVNYIAGASPGTGKAEIYFNGVLLTTLTTLKDDGTLGYPAVVDDPATDSLYSAILNTRVNGTDAYDVYWSDILASAREEYYDAAGIAPAAIASGDMLLGTYVDRRGLDWDGRKSAWMHAVSGGGSINTGNGTVSPSITGAQFGLDLLALGDVSTRFGATFGYGSQSSGITLPSGASGGTVSGNSPSVGAYITHADSNMYVDVLGQYRWVNTNVAAPTSTGTVSGNSTDVTAETGFHFGSGAVTITPFAQLSYQHLTLNSTTLGGLPVTFGNSDSLIGRARVLIEAKNAGLKLFGSVGIASDLLGAKTVTVDGTPFSSTLGGARAEFTGGVEGMLTASTSVYGSGEYDVSFEGKSTSYAARAGFRAGF